MKHWKWHDIHHIVWKCNHPRARVDNADNKLVMLKSKHVWLNALFQTLQSPYEQLLYLRHELYDKVLSDTAKQLFDSLLALGQEWMYKENMYKNKPLNRNNKNNGKIT